jgi:serine/threonine-protein kinase RsbW
LPDREGMPFELEMPAKAKYVGLARLLAGSIGRRMRFSEESIDDLKLAISEICTNAIVHTGDGDTERPPILISYLLCKDFITVTVKDQGPGFDPGLILDREREGLLSKGFGIPLIKSLVDVFECDSHPKSGTIVTITKFLKPEKSEL